MKKTQRKITQICSRGQSDDIGSGLFALCDDGTVWQHNFDQSYWYEMTPITRCRRLVTKRYCFKDGRTAGVTLEYEKGSIDR